MIVVIVVIEEIIVPKEKGDLNSRPEIISIFLIKMFYMILNQILDYTSKKRFFLIHFIGIEQISMISIQLVS